MGLSPWNSIKWEFNKMVFCITIMKVCSEASNVYFVLRHKLLKRVVSDYRTETAINNLM